MKRQVICLLTLALLLFASTALAAGNVNIAIFGRDGMDSSINHIFVSGDQLILLGYEEMYTWSEETGLVKAEGYKGPDTLYTAEGSEDDGILVVTLGSEEIELDEGERFHTYNTYYAIDGRLYFSALVSDEEYVDYKSYLVEIVVNDNGEVSVGEVVDMDDALIEYYDGYSSYITLESTCDVGGILYGLGYTNDGRQLVALDIENRDVEFLPVDMDYLMCMSAFDEDRLLMVEMNYGANSTECDLVLYDIDSGDTTTLGVLPTTGYASPSAICYDSERGKLYYTLSGSVWRMDVSEDGIGEPEEFGDMPLQDYSNTSGVLMGDLYIVSSYDGVVGRDVTIEKMPDEHLIIEGGAYTEPIRNAYYDFTEEHPEYSVSLRDLSGDGDDLVQAMMTRSSDVDIYVMTCETGIFSALKSRGYMAELGGSETLTAFVGGLYPFLQDLSMVDGELYAVPIDLYSWTFGYNRALLVDKLGFREDELPTSWEGLFRMIADMSKNSRMQDVPEASLMDPYLNQDDAKSLLFRYMMEDYLLWLSADEENLSRGSEALLRLCEAFEQIDWTNLNIPEDTGSGDSYIFTTDENNIILDTGVSILPWYYLAEGMFVPPFSLLDGEAGQVPASVDLVFVNPFSTHREAAIEYIEMATRQISENVLLAMNPSMNDPIENPDYEENLQFYEEQIAQYEESIAAAEEEGDDENVANLTENLEYYIEYMNEYKESGRYLISSAEIEEYRRVAQYLIPATSYSGSEDAYQQINQYIDGAIDAQQLVHDLERSIQMRQQEGM